MRDVGALHERGGRADLDPLAVLAVAAGAGRVVRRASPVVARDGATTDREANPHARRAFGRVDGREVDGALLITQDDRRRRHPHGRAEAVRTSDARAHLERRGAVRHGDPDLGDDALRHRAGRRCRPRRGVSEPAANLHAVSGQRDHRRPSGCIGPRRRERVGHVPRKPRPFPRDHRVVRDRTRQRRQRVRAPSAREDDADARLAPEQRVVPLVRDGDAASLERRRQRLRVARRDLSAPEHRLRGLVRRAAGARPRGARVVGVANGDVVISERRPVAPIGVGAADVVGADRHVAARDVAACVGAPSHRVARVLHPHLGC